MKLNTGCSEIFTYLFLLDKRSKDEDIKFESNTIVIVIFTGLLSARRSEWLGRELHKFHMPKIKRLVIHLLFRKICDQFLFHI